MLRLTEQHHPSRSFRSFTCAWCADFESWRPKHGREAHEANSCIHVVYGVACLERSEMWRKLVQLVQEKKYATKWDVLLQAKDRAAADLRKQLTCAGPLHRKDWLM